MRMGKGREIEFPPRGAKTQPYDSEFERGRRGDILSERVGVGAILGSPTTSQFAFGRLKSRPYIDLLIAALLSLIAALLSWMN